EELVLCHGGQQLQQLLWFLQIELPRRGANKKIGHHRLTDVHRVQGAPQTHVGQAGANDTPDGRLIFAHQLVGGLGIAGSDALEEGCELGGIARHGPSTLRSERERSYIPHCSGVCRGGSSLSASHEKVLCNATSTLVTQFRKSWVSSLPKFRE